ncbi:hypothetical protein BU24DRAFT_375196 [Aaosphaeria arxii CBS 175.79]|uniref:Nab2-like CCCH zinc finger domain-containing protein n=1 Tax=Aaosphaeria arxii CBS 175.79 TaxID=1450172 RepID=A0A6A5XGC4_9PLEO|nr:uncharacterized protein BU24DRAFT_375196 [Aaosphaeria arxii CBS 175.79]KAF2011909.1 hypothetical protein BU24DRAFT_375196 [Aaosphaeria arxii CBS 175.79]
MAVDFSSGTPFASALQSVVQPKLAEYGWTTGDAEDSTIFEYILLMLGNNKNESQIASELSNDLLDLGPENPETQQFAHWLFEQIDFVRRQLDPTAASADASHANVDQMEHDASGSNDADMDGSGDASQGSIPTGPKAMRNGSSGAKISGSGRMLNQMNKQMNRHDDSALHRVRGAGGAGRINSHSHNAPKGPRGQNIGRGLNAMANGRGVGNVGVNMGAGGMNGGMGMNNMGGMPGMPGMPPMGQNGGMPGMLNAQQQMALMQMYEQQAQMMQQIFSGQTPSGPFVNPNFQQNGRGKGRPFSDRVDKSRQGGKQSKFSKKESQDEAMTDSAPGAENGDSAMDTEHQDPSSTMCKFNLRCGKPDCPFVHQSPAAPEGTPVDMSNECTYGAACKNKKCVGKHPSPAQRQQFQSEQECAFFPNCRDPLNCPYKHPSMPACRNGADCTTPGCKFWHNTVMCKYTPCTNFRCPYKHAEGQKKTFKDKVWVAPKAGEEDGNNHVSERKFVDENEEEELIIPGKSTEDVQIAT